MSAKLKHRWSLGHNYLAGVSAGDWWRLLRENRFAVDPAYWHRAAFVSLVSFINSYYRRQEERRFGPAIEKVEITEPPLFVLGHWRSGTTHLHNLLALDTDQFAFANTYQVVNPHTFLSTEEVNTRRFAFLLPDKRPMDNMALSFASPQEDEFAMLLSCFYSLYLGISFPRREAHYSRYLTFDGVPENEIAEWKGALLRFMKKLTCKHGRALVLKSPPHTARIRLLLDMFPRARFVHIHRHPCTVFRSTQHYFDTAVWYTYLQRPKRETVDRGILDRYTAMYDSFFEYRGLIPPGNFHEMSFEDLERVPLAEMRRLYEALSLPGFDAVEPRLKGYLASLDGYKRNEYEELSSALRETVATEWRRSFDEWGYSH
ncbi:MAG: sulfotransferase family protein [Deltaproteobacteria bacterium]